MLPPVSRLPPSSFCFHCYTSIHLYILFDIPLVTEFGRPSLVTNHLPFARSERRYLLVLFSSTSIGFFIIFTFFSSLYLPFSLCQRILPLASLLYILLTCIVPDCPRIESGRVGYNQSLSLSSPVSVRLVGWLVGWRPSWCLDILPGYTMSVLGLLSFCSRLFTGLGGWVVSTCAFK